MVVMNRKLAVDRADVVMGSVAERYPDILATQVEALRTTIAKADYEAARRGIQNIVGEAPGFGWPSVGTIAAIMREVAEEEVFSPKSQMAIKLALDAIKLVISENHRELDEPNEERISQLKRLIARLRGNA
ncbi:MAG: hypothetical protein AAF527_08565 [Pseudomonadota bacterium]